jgi:hypothetical protein
LPILNSVGPNSPLGTVAETTRSRDSAFVGDGVLTVAMLNRILHHSEL